MLPTAHIAYSWAALALAQEELTVAPHADYRLVALAAAAPDLIDKPLAAAYFYRRHKAAVLFAHTLLFFCGIFWLGHRFPRHRVYAWVVLGHALLDRLWHFPDTFYWPLRGWRFHTWGKRGSEQTQMGLAYWYAFTRRPELWGWELGGLLALLWFIRRHRLYRWERLLAFLLSGRVRSSDD